MNSMNQFRFDLNLLTVFDALMRERHTGRAGERLGLTQPAVSHALSRLRDLTGDPLFVRHARGVRPTARAHVLAESILPALDVLRTSVHARQAFDPTSISRTITIGCSDYVELTILPRLLAEVAQRAPALDLRIRNLTRGEAESSLRRRDVDLALGPVQAAPSPSDTMTLFEERFILVARRDHPMAKKGLSAEAFAQWPQALVSAGGDASGQVDLALRERGLVRRIAVVVPRFTAVPFLVAATDLIALLPERIAACLQDAAPIRVQADPLQLPHWTVGLSRIPDQRGDGCLDWLCTLISDIGRSMQTTTTPRQRKRPLPA